MYGKYECLVMQLVYVCVLGASFGISKCCILHNLQFLNSGRGCNEATIWKRHTPEPVS